MLKKVLFLCAVFATTAAAAAAQPAVQGAQAAVQVDSSNLEAPRPMNKQTRDAVVRDYLESWQMMSAALAQNRADLLDAGFIGTAKDRLTDAIRDQAGLGISTLYQDHAHNIRLLFYSPEGLSIELEDVTDYDVQVLDHGTPLTTKPQHVRYIVVLTPSEVRWRVRILQASPD
jgi:hypothetical protein